MPTIGFSTKPLKVKLLAGEQISQPSVCWDSMAMANSPGLPAAFVGLPSEADCAGHANSNSLVRGPRGFTRGVRRAPARQALGVGRGSLWRTGEMAMVQSQWYHFGLCCGDCSPGVRDFDSWPYLVIYVPSPCPDVGFYLQQGSLHKGSSSWAPWS